MSQQQQVNGNSGSTDKSASSLVTELEQLQDLLVQDPELEGEAMADPDIAALLQRMQAAEDLSQGVEGKLDGILNNLDNLLASLEAEAERIKAEKEVSASTSAAEVKADP